MKKAENLFNGSLGAYHRGWFGFLFEVSLSDFGKEKCNHLFDEFPGIHPEIIVDLIKNLCGAGFMKGAENSLVPYDGSRIDHVTERVIDPSAKTVLLKDFSVLRSDNLVSVDQGLRVVKEFLSENRSLLHELSDFHGSFWDIYPFGVFRCESLLSMIGIKKMTIEQYLLQWSINLRERKRLFGDKFALVHTSSGIPIDHDPKRKIFYAEGHSWRIGKILVNKKEKEVFLRIGLGDGDGYMGMSMTIALESPKASFYKVAYQMVLSDEQEIVPQFIVAQVSPMQINDQLEFVSEFLPHEDFPSKDPLFKVEAAITQLLGGGDIFDTMIIALINYYRAEGYNSFVGIKGEDNLWLKYHADEMVESLPGAEGIIAKRAKKIYCDRFARLGFSRVNGWWMTNDFMQTMESALSFRETGKKKVKVLCRCEGREVSRRVKLPVTEVCVAEAGLAKLGERVFAELPLSNTETCLNELFGLFDLFRSVKRQSLAPCYAF